MTKNTWQSGQKFVLPTAKKVNAELLFVNTSSFGVQYPDGTFHHIHADELAQILGIDEAKA